MYSGPLWSTRVDCMCLVWTNTFWGLVIIYLKSLALKYHVQKWNIHHEGSKKTFFFPITCWWNNHLEIAHIIAVWLDSFAAYTHKWAGCPGSSKYTIHYVLFVFVKFQELLFTKHSFLYFQDFHAVEFSRVTTRSLWVVFHQAGSWKNEQSLLFQGILELSQATNFLKEVFDYFFTKKEVWSEQSLLFQSL